MNDPLLNPQATLPVQRLVLAILLFHALSASAQEPAPPAVQADSPVVAAPAVAPASPAVAPPAVQAASPAVTVEPPLAQAITAFKQGDYTAAEQLLKVAADEALKQGDRPAGAEILFKLGFLYDHIGKFDKAIDAYGDAYQLARASTDMGLTAQVAFNTAASSLSLGDAQRALAIYEELLLEFDAAGAQSAKAACLQNRGTILMQQGQLTQAFKDLNDALQIYEGKNSQADIAQTATNLGILMTTQGIYPKAEEYLKRAEGILTTLNDARGLATVFTNEADLARLQGQVPEALALLKKALETKRSTGDKMGEAAALETMARIHRQQDHFPKSEESLQQALYLRTEMRDALGEGNCHLLLGQWLVRDGSAENFDKASTHLERARDAFQRAGYRQALQRVLYWEGRIAEVRGDSSTAEKKYSEAISLLESMTSRLPDEFGEVKKSGAERSEPYVALISLLAQQDRLSEALALVERSNDQTLAGTLIGATTKETELQAKMNALREGINKARATNDDKLAELLTQEAKGAEDAYTQHVEKLFKDNPRLYALTQVKPDSLARMRKHIDSKSLMIQYLFFEDALFLFAVTSEKLEYKTIKIDKPNLEARINYMRDLLGVSFRFYPRSTEEMDKEKPEWRQEYKSVFLDPINQVSLEIYQEILAPLKELMAGKSRLIILPNQCLHYLPFAALVQSLEGGKPRYLVEDYEILKQGSLTLLDFARSSDVKGVTGELKILAIGNADGSLPSAQDEAEKIKTVFANAEILIRDQALEDIVKAQCSQQDVLHLATHAFLDPSNLDKSYIKLAPDLPKGEDGKLWRREVLDLNLDRVQLVTLSACQTALGERTLQGDEVYGLEQSFVKAGAETVISTLWPVEDKATGLFMQDFYKNLSASIMSNPAERKMNRLNALRTAQLTLLANPQYSHPYFWAPFVMTGEAD